MQTTFNTFVDNAKTILASTHTAGSGSLVLSSNVFGSTFPIMVTVITAGSYQTSAESLVIYTATGVTGSTLTGVTATEGTTDQNFAAGSIVELRWTAGEANLISTAVNTLEGTVQNVKSYGAKGDGRTVTDASMTLGSKTLTSASLASFSSADVGKTVTVVGAGTSSGTLAATISFYTSSTQVTLSVAAATAVSSATANISTSDITAIQNALNAGGNVYFPPGQYYLYQGLTLSKGSTRISADPGTVLWSGTALYPVITVQPAQYSVSSYVVDSTGSTATVTTTTAHGMAVGAKVFLEGTNYRAFNGMWVIATVPTTTSFTIALPQYTVSVLTSGAGTATAATETLNYWSTNYNIWIAGATQAAYNGAVSITAVDSTHFTYSVTGSPASPATTSTSITAALAPSSVTGTIIATPVITDVTFRDLDFNLLPGAGLSSNNALQVQYVDGLTLDNISSVNSGLGGVFVGNSDHVALNAITTSNARLSGLIVYWSRWITATGCMANNCTTFYGFEFKNCMYATASGCSSDNCYNGFGTIDMAVGYRPTLCSFISCHSTTSVLNGFYLQGLTSGSVTGCSACNNGGSGIASDATSYNLRIECNSCDYNAADGIGSGSNQMIVQGNSCQYNGGSGIGCTALTSGIVQGNRCVDNAYHYIRGTSPNYYSGIELRSGCTYNRISGNHIMWFGSPSQQSYGIAEDSGGGNDYNWIEGNFISGAQVVAQYLVSGANTVQLPIGQANSLAAGATIQTPMTLGLNHITFGTAAPTSGTWVRGDICYNTGVTSSTTPGWSCTSAGTPGIWTAWPVL